MVDFAAVGTAFVSHYYTTFDGGLQVRQTGLAPLYRAESMLTWEANQLQGQANILAQLCKPELQTVVHKASSIDCQPTPGGGVIVSVTGTLAIDNAFDKPMLFAQTFHLQPIPNQAGGFYVYNDIFRLVFAS